MKKTRGKALTACGFTLIELLIVVVVIGILTAFAIPQAARVKEGSYRGTMRYDLRNLVTAQEAYFTDNQSYAPTLAELGNLYKISQDVTITLTSVTTTTWSGEAEHAFSPTTCTVDVEETRVRGPSCS